MLSASAAMAKIANYVSSMKKKNGRTKSGIVGLRADVYDAAVLIVDQTKNNRDEFLAQIKAAYPRRQDCIEAFLEQTFRFYAEFDGDYRLALRCVEQGASKREFVNAPFDMAFRNPVPRSKRDSRTEQARMRIASDTPRTRHVEFDAAVDDAEPRVTTVKASDPYQRIKELERELGVKNKLIEAQAAEIKMLREKLKARAA